MESVKRSEIKELLFLQVHTEDRRVMHVPFDAAVKRSALLAALVRNEQQRLQHQRRDALSKAETSAGAGTLTSVRVVLVLEQPLDSWRLPRDAFLAVCAYLEAADAAAADAVAQRMLDYAVFDELVERIVAFHYMGVPAVTALLARTLNMALTEAVTPRQARDALKIPPEDCADPVPDDPFFRGVWRRATAGADDEQHARAGAEEDAAEEDDEEAAGSAGEAPVPRRIRIRRLQTQQDPDSESCFHCRCRVGTALRPRRVCQCCGGTFCSDHCYQTAVLPFPAVRAPRSLLGLVRRGLSAGQPVVCTECHGYVTRDERMDAKCLRALRIAAVPVVSARKAGSLTAKLYLAATHYLDALRALQYRLPAQPLSALERRMVFGSRRAIAGHALWSLALLRATNWADTVQHQEAAALLRPELLPASEKPLPCADALCAAAGCRGQGLGPLDCAVALDATQYPVPPDVRAILVDRLRSASTEQLLPLLPQLVHCIRYDPRPQLPALLDGDDHHQQQQEECPLSAFLMERALGGFDAAARASVEFVCQLYWRLAIEGYECLRDMLVAALARHSQAGRELAGALAAERTFTAALRARAIPTMHETLAYFVRAGCVRVPTDPTQRFTAITAVQELPARWYPLLLDYHSSPTAPSAPSPSAPQAAAAAVDAVEEVAPTEDRTRRVAFVNQDATFGVLLRNLLVLLKDVVADCTEEALRTLPLRALPVCQTSASSAFVDVDAKLAACRGQAFFHDLFGSFFAGARSPEAIKHTMMQSAAFYAALAYLFGFVLDDMAVDARGALLPMNLACCVREHTTPAELLPLPLVVAFAGDKGFRAMSTAYYLKLRAVAVHVHALFQLVAWQERALNPCSVLGARLTQHLVDHARFNGSDNAAARAYEQMLGTMSVVVGEAQFEQLRADTAKTLSQCLFCCMTAPARQQPKQQPKQQQQQQQLEEEEESSRAATTTTTTTTTPKVYEEDDEVEDEEN